MRKYLSFILSFVIFVSISLFFLQRPTNSFAAGIPVQQKTENVSCTCDNPGTADSIDSSGNQINKNGFHCGPVTSYGGFQDPESGNKNSYLAVGSCAHREQACDPASNTATIGPQEQPIGAGSTIKFNFVGVSCQVGTVTGGNGTTKKAITCGCSTQTTQTIKGKNGKKVQVPSSVACTNNVTHTTQTNACGGAAICVKGSGLSYSGFSNQSVQGIGCEQSCVCDHSGPPTSSNNSVGNDNNGWKCYDSNGQLPSTDTAYCHNLEDYCQNDPNHANGVECVNSTTCSCTDSNTEVYCSSPASGDAPITIACGGGQQCMTGQQYGQQDIYNQTVYGAACVNVELPPPPSPPCAQWLGGQCISFASGFGAFSTDPSGFIQNVFAILLSVSGGIALLLIIRAGYQLMTSQGKPEQLQQGRDQLIAAIVGLVFLIFSFVFLELIGVDIFHIPGFSGANTGGTCAPNSCIQQSLCTAKNPGHCDTNGCPAGEACIQQ